MSAGMRWRRSRRRLITVATLALLLGLWVLLVWGGWR